MSDLKGQNLMGINYVRPPLLKFNKKKETDNYTEYEIITYKDSKNQSEENNDKTFTNDIDSLIYCNESITIQVPKRSFMKKNNKAKFAYAFGMFPNPKNGQAAYLDGCILGALGLKRQNTLADVICFITPDISTEDKTKLEVVFDKVIYVPYISPYKMKGEGKLSTIMMDPGIFKNCPNYTKEHPYSHVFFKLHIFNPELFPYEKVCFVDSDLVPMNYYDSLFMLDTPAGWVEYRKKWPYQKSFHWDRCDYLEHGKPIPKIFTDTGTKGASDVNAGLLLVKPDKKEYESMIKQLTSPVDQWLGPGKEHIGFYDMDLDMNKSITGRKFVDSSYCYPEQNYLTKRFSGKWKYIEYSFQSWSLDPCNSFGIHMAAFNPKPWFKQPANSEIKSRGGQHPYFDSEIFVSDIPRAVVPEDENLILENISISYELFNDLIIWGFVNYPKLVKFFLEGTKIYGTKLSFGEDVFKDLSKQNEFKLLKDITKDDPDYKKLSISQQYISNLINDYSNFVGKVKDKYLSICHTKYKDRYDDRVFRPQVITYPNHISKSVSEKNEYLKHGQIPFGQYKGLSINSLTMDQAQEVTKTRYFHTNSDLREAFSNSKYDSLVREDKFYASIKKIKKNKSKKTKRKNKRGGQRKTTEPKRQTRKMRQTRKTRQTRKMNQGKSLIYYKMKNCKYCKIFERDLWQSIVKWAQNNNIKTTVIERETNPDLVPSYIKSYPSLVSITNGHPKLFSEKKTLPNIKNFLVNP